MALQLGALDTATLQLENAVGGADLVLLASPVESFIPLLKAVAKAAPKGCLVADVGSVKGPAPAWARAAAPLAFVPSHPMAGSEKTGVEAARAGLFERSACILTPLPGTPKAALLRVERLWKALGCHTHRMDPRRHDALIAALSHLPHAAAFSLVRAVARLAKAGDYALAGKGYRDTTRVGGSDAAMWAGIFLANRRNLIKGLGAYQRELAALQALLAKGDAQALAARLGQASRLRQSL
jgi:prephenate dehydrogenase